MNPVSARRKEASPNEISILDAVAILAPRFPRLREWAYAGMVFVCTGAVASRLAVGDPSVTFIGPIIFTGIVAASLVVLTI
jgi:hypothetical protein